MPSDRNKCGVDPMTRGVCAAGLCALLAVAAHPSFAAGGGRGAPAGGTGAVRGGWVGAARPLRPPLPLADGVSDIIVDAPAQRVLVTTSSRVYVLDEATGRPLGSVPLPGRRPTFSSPTSIDPRTGAVVIFIGASGDSDGTRPADLALLDGRTGTVRRIVHIGGKPSYFVADARRHRLYLFDGNKPGARVFDTSALAPRGTWPGLGNWPTIDERTGRVYASTAKGIALYDEDSRAVLASRALGGPAGGAYLDARSEHLFLLGAPGEPPPTAMSGASGYVTPDPGYFSILDARTLRVLDVGNGCADGAAADARRGRMVCLNISPSTAGPGDLSHLPPPPNDVGFAIVDLRSGAVVHSETLFSGLQADASVATDERTGRTIIVTTHQPTGETPCPCTGIGVYDTRTGRFVGAGPSVVDSLTSPGIANVVPDSQTGIDYYVDGRNRLTEFRDADATY